MKPIVAVLGFAGVMGVAVLSGQAFAQTAKNAAAKSPLGPADEIGTLNMMTDASRLDVLKQVVSGKVYDLGVDCLSACRTAVVPSWIPMHDRDQIFSLLIMCRRWRRYLRSSTTSTVGRVGRPEREKIRQRACYRIQALPRYFEF